MLDWKSLPPGTPMWVSIGIVVAGWVLANHQKLAQVAGPLGWLARLATSRELRELDRSETLDKRISDAVKRRTDEQLQPMREQLERMEERLALAERELATERDERDKERAWYRGEIARRDEDIRDLNSYAEGAVKREYQIQEWAASLGLEPPEPKIVLYSTWRRALRDVT